MAGAHRERQEHCGSQVTEEVVIRSATSADSYLALRADPWDDTSMDFYEGPDVTVELCCDDLRAVAVLPAYIADGHALAPLMHEIDRDWRGWEGEKSAGMPDESWLAVTATHDGSGHVELTVHLGSGWPMFATWLVKARFRMDVGSAARHARDLDAWVAKVWPPESRYHNR